MRNLRWIAVLLALVCLASTAAAAPSTPASSGGTVQAQPALDPGLKPMIAPPVVEGMKLVDVVRATGDVGVAPLWRGPAVRAIVPSQFAQRAEAAERAAGGKVNTDGISWVGIYYDYVSNSLAWNDHYADVAVAFCKLGKGVCMDQSQKLSVTGKINFGATAKFTSVISSSFGFEASGTKEFTVTYKYCGPSESSDAQLRTFYRQLYYNQYNSSVTRCWWSWNGTFLGCEASYTTQVDVPYLAVWSEDT